MSCCASFIDGGLELRGHPFYPGREFIRLTTKGYAIGYRNETERECIRQVVLRVGRRLGVRLYTRSDAGVLTIWSERPPHAKPMTAAFVDGGFTEYELAGLGSVRALRKAIATAMVQERVR